MTATELAVYYAAKFAIIALAAFTATMLALFMTRGR